MLDIYDGNNILRRAMDKTQLGKAPIMSLRMRYEQACSPTYPQIWVWDGYKHNERRRDIYPLYKTNREPTPENIFAQIKLFRDVLKHSGATQIEVAGWEADDVIGTVVRQMAAKAIRTRVHTNDMDYAQIAEYCDLIGVNTKGVPNRWVPLYKAMNGDTSDNIKGIKGFGHGAWTKMEPYWPQIERAIVQGSPAGFQGLPFTPAVRAWLTSQENVDLLQAMLTVTHFENVPNDEIEGGIIEGRLDRQAGHALLGKFFL